MEDWTKDDIPSGFFKTKLSLIIAEKGLTIKEAAKEIGCSRGYLNKITNRTIPCGRKMAFRISKWSGGRINPLELITQGRSLANKKEQAEDS